MSCLRGVTWGFGNVNVTVDYGKYVYLLHLNHVDFSNCAMEYKTPEIGKETIGSKQLIQFHCFCSEK